MRIGLPKNQTPRVPGKCQWRSADWIYIKHDPARRPAVMLDPAPKGRMYRGAEQLGECYGCGDVCGVVAGHPIKEASVTPLSRGTDVGGYRCPSDTVSGPQDYAGLVRSTAVPYHWHKTNANSTSSRSASIGRPRLASARPTRYFTELKCKPSSSAAPV